MSIHDFNEQQGLSSWSFDTTNAFEESASFYDQNLASTSSYDPFQSNKQNTNEQYKAEPMTIKVDDPLKSSDGFFVTYRVFTMTALPNYSVDNRPVRRRFQDFVWLHNALSVEFSTCVIPPLPEKHRLKYMKGDGFDSAFIEHRRLCLQWFMDRIARHPLLQASHYTRLFLESTDFKSDKKIFKASLHQNHSLFGSLFKSLVKVKKPDEKFIEMKDTIDKFEDNLNIVEKLYHRIGKRQQELEQNYSLFASSIRGLSALETNVDQPLRQFAEATESYIEALKEMRKQEDLLFLNDVHELINYCHATKEQLIERDQKQVNFEDVSAALQSIVLERERLLYPGKNLGRAAAGNMNITDIMQDKMSDNGKARTERLQDEVTKANDISNKYSSQMMKEYEIFKKSKEIELKQGLAAYADCHIDFYKKSISIWENILPVLDQIQLEDL
ncbi:uncharacterized protein BX663DRAFT_490602 [Cokeromyces recurvatus]|uniref:uncharacterized protein n=1 Tax=Cokeromyces recurvatus TaxID=90255 RepID=UPI0022208EC9|nr:uncharacterized protein BX663DRAFT_490602 [Cokeromyces recurvatus]KAI7897773.1 hypothetical protein BX663DRAFT_490602 [Cokeromyces recurvatus]